MLSVVVTLILTSLSIAREREGVRNFWPTDSKSSFVLGNSDWKNLSSIGDCTLFDVLYDVFGNNVFHLPLKGSVFLLLISIAIALLSIVGVGLFISSICKTQQQAILSVMTFMMPAMLLSGFISPIEDMPVCLQYGTYLNPVRFFMVLTRSIFLKGMGVQDVVANLVPLICISVLTLTLASRTFKRKLD